MLIAFSGKMGSGKDEAAEYLKDKYSGTKYSFAKPIYDILHYAQFICGFEYKKDRKLLQFIGTEWARNIDKDVWVKIALLNIESSKESAKESSKESAKESSKESAKESAKENFFITDLRHLNELKALKEHNWICIQIKRDAIDLDRAGTGNINHSSELELENISADHWDFVIENNGTLSEFHQKLDDIVDTIIGKSIF